MAPNESCGKKLLVVEDNDVQREGLATILSAAGYAIQKAASGTQATESLRAQKPDLILLDMLLPDDRADGWVVLDQIQRNPEWTSIPVIIMTGLGIASEEWARSLGAVSVVPKPIDTNDLLSKVRYYCQ
jgi:twitching motility two-component system response regulator PilH